MTGKTDKTEQTPGAAEAVPTVPGRPCWLELYTAQTEAAAAFYGSLLGWEVSAAEPGAGISTEVTRAGHLLASFEAPDAEAGTGDLSGWVVTLAVEDVQEALAKVEEAGGRILVPFIRVSPTVSYALVADPSGAPVGMIADEEAEAPSPGGPGLPVWYDLLVPDLEQGLRFYREVFGWRAHQLETDGTASPFWTNGKGMGAVCGIGDASFFGGQAAPAAWRVYFGVPDADEAAARVRELGGEVVSEPMDTPWGRIAEVRDPQGARFMLCQ